MNALEALKIARETPGLIARPTARNLNVPVGWNSRKQEFRHFVKFANGPDFIYDFPTVDVIALVNPEGSPVEWEVIREEEL